MTTFDWFEEWSSYTSLTVMEVREKFWCTELAMEWHLVDFSKLEFLKIVDHLITYQSGGSCVQVKYIFFIWVYESFLSIKVTKVISKFNSVIQLLTIPVLVPITYPVVNSLHMLFKLDYYKSILMLNWYVDHKFLETFINIRNKWQKLQTKNN